MINNDITKVMNELLKNKKKSLNQVNKLLESKQKEINFLLALKVLLDSNVEKVEEQDLFPTEPEKEFDGLSIADRAERVLEANGKLLSNAQIFKIMMKKGIAPKGKQPRNSLYGILNSYRQNNKRFYRENGKWGLLKWKTPEETELFKTQEVNEKDKEQQI